MPDWIPCTELLSIWSRNPSLMFWELSSQGYRPPPMAPLFMPPKPPQPQSSSRMIQSEVPHGITVGALIRQ